MKKAKSVAANARGKIKAPKDAILASLPADTAAKPAGATIAQVAKRIGLSVQRVTVLIDQGVIPRASRGGHDIDRATLLYIEHLRAKASGRGDGSSSGPRSRLDEVKAARAEFDYKVATSGYLPADEVLATWRNTVATVRSVLLTMAGKVASRGAGVERKELREIIDHEVRAALTELSQSQTFSKKRAA